MKLKTVESFLIIDKFIKEFERNQYEQKLIFKTIKKEVKKLKRGLK